MLKNACHNKENVLPFTADNADKFFDMPGRNCILDEAGIITNLSA